MNQYDLEITVLGDPKAQGRPRAAKRGKFIQVYDDPNSRKAKDDLRAVIQSKAPAKPFDCPLQVDLGFYMPRPKGHYGTGKNANRLKPTAPLLHTSKPDIDNLRKLVMDAMTGVFWRDDALVCKGTTTKEYSARPRTEIRVKQLLTTFKTRRGETMKAWQSQLTVNAIEVLAEDIHEWAKGKGFWDEDRNDGECIALMHSELSEALESIRHGSPADHHCPEFSSTEIEFADCLIRILDTCKSRGYRIGEAIRAKMDFNETRPHKHGKKF